MANINGNNIDDLFRQASDQYPLRTNSSDWEKLASALEADPSLISPPVIEQDDRRRRKRFLWLLLLLPLGGLGYYAMQSNIHAITGAGMTNANGAAGDAKEANIRSGSDTKTVQTDTRTGINGETKTGVSAERKTGISEETKTGMSAEAGKGINAETGKGAKQAKGQIAESGGGGNKNLEMSAHPKTSPGSEKNRGGALVRSAGSGMAGDRNHVTGNKITGNKLAGNKVTSNTISSNDLTANNSTGNDLSSNNATKIDAMKINATAPKDPAFSRVNGPAGHAAGEPSVTADVRSKGGETPGQTSPAPLKKASPNKERHAIYVGLLGAPDLSTIHMQSVKSVGTTFGILGGYTFNPKWSIETGVYLDMKRYYTEGQYFSKKNVQPLRYVDLLDVNGSCNMVEIPINLRYNLSSGKNRKWFATAGLSTYLMSKEWYDYHYLYYGTSMDNAFTYRNPYHYLFSVLNMSLGYEQKLGRIGNLRLEPYLRVPLSGIGTGSLSIMSAGLNVGITRRIW